MDKNKLVISDEELENASLDILLNWMPNHINNNHIYIFKWKDGKGWTISDGSIYNFKANNLSTTKKELAVQQALPL